MAATKFGLTFGELRRVVDHMPFPPRQSKRQRKRALAANARRAHHKAKKKAKKEARRAAADPAVLAAKAAALAAAQCMSAEDRAVVLAGRAAKRAARGVLCAAGQRIVIDCEFGHLMHDREHVSLVQQIMYCYGRNKRVREAPCGLHLTGVDAGFRRRLTRISGFDNWIGCTTTDRPYIRTFDKSSLVYLTADSPLTVETLDPSKTYIIGGIVDRNRHKNLTMNKAAAQGIATANLPIRGHLERLNCSDVLTVDQVFALLISYMDQGDWGVAVESSVPQRKRK